MQHMRNLTLASAKHLLGQGHITQQQHDHIVKKVRPKRAAPVMRQAFGSLAPQQAQAPIPGYAGSAGVPSGTATGYE